jgi:hypothetical protein
VLYPAELRGLIDVEPVGGLGRLWTDRHGPSRVSGSRAEGG